MGLQSMDMNNVLIKKADGEEEIFDLSKLEASLARAGAGPEMRHRVAIHVVRELKPGMTTDEIYRHAFELLRREESAPIAARYSIKRAVFALGPSGFPFEQFIAEILRAHGWTARTGAALNGHCAPHEVDVLAQKGGRRVGIEAKFHNDASGKTDIKDALYVHARYHDLQNATEESSRVDEGWLVTNTSFTHNAINYAQCSHLTLLGWDYPVGRGLVQMIEEAKVHPLTCLTSLTEGEKRQLLDNKIVLCKSVQSRHLLEEYGVRPARVPQVMDEAKLLCGI